MQAGTLGGFAALLIAILLVVPFWCAICFLVSLITGWFSLGRRFKREAGPYGETKTAGPLLYTVYMRFWSHYSSVVRLTSGSDALYASVIFPFRIGHPPLRIPWNEIQTGTKRYFFRNYIVLMLGNEEKIPMRISERMARKLGILDRCPV